MARGTAAPNLPLGTVTIGGIAYLTLTAIATWEFSVLADAALDRLGDVLDDRGRSSAPKSFALSPMSLARSSVELP
ncbi:MAG: hypothetical protein AAF317_20340 [Pseudomonadota bacterium]